MNSGKGKLRKPDMFHRATRDSVSLWLTWMPEALEEGMEKVDKQYFERF